MIPNSSTALDAILVPHVQLIMKFVLTIPFQSQGHIKRQGSGVPQPRNHSPPTSQISGRTVMGDVTVLKVQGTDNLAIGASEKNFLPPDSFLREV